MKDIRASKTEDIALIHDFESFVIAATIRSLGKFIVQSIPHSVLTLFNMWAEDELDDASSPASPEQEVLPNTPP